MHACARELADGHGDLSSEPSGRRLPDSCTVVGEQMSNANDATSVVYVVDDDVDICRGLQILLSSVGLEVRTFGKPGDFLSQCDMSRPGCIVLDLRLPEMSGHIATER